MLINKMQTPLKLNSKYILFIAMAYLTVSLAADVVAFRFCDFLGLVESGATIIFPFSYILSDTICEVYGWNIAMKIVWMMLFLEILFAILITLVIHTPLYGIGTFQNEYNDVLGNILLFVLAGVFGNSFCAFLNIFFISKSKILSQGKKFWLRSISATCISELMLVFITVGIAFTPILSFKPSFTVFIDAYILEITYSILFVLPAQMLVNFLKKKESIDAYDYGISYNPFKFA